MQKLAMLTSVVAFAIGGTLFADDATSLPSGAITIQPDAHQREQLEQLQQFQQRMEAKTITIDADRMPLYQFIEKLSKQADVPMTIDRPELQNNGITLNSPISINGENLSPRTVLTLSLNRLGLSFQENGNGVTITSRDKSDSRLQTKTYSLAELVGNHTESVTAWRNVIANEIARDSWEQLGGLGTIYVFDKTLIVNQTKAVHTEITYLLNLAARVKQFSSDDYPVTSLMASERDEATQQLRDKIVTTEIEVTFEEAPLRDAIRELNKSWPMKVRIDERSLSAVDLKGPLPVTLSAGRHSAKSVLNEITTSLGLKWCVISGDSAVITSDPRKYQVKEFRLYPVRDLVWHGLKIENGSQRNTLIGITRWQGDSWNSVDYLKSLRAPGLPQLPDNKSLEQVIQSTIRPDSWEVLGGPSTLSYVAEIDCLLIAQMPETHDEIARLLHLLRQQQTPETAAKLLQQIEDSNDEIVTARYPLSWNTTTSQPDEAGLNTILELIRSGTGETQWQIPEASISFAHDSLVVRQRRDVQRQILTMLIKLDLVHPVAKTDSSKASPAANYSGGGGGGFF
ncbi:hypothetical protein DTL21_15525 [Bremerella cremea]|uniref:Secretin/TonB short N-terminal domain-containing protein n=1 Tax=Blastopirellula marina TaxID=124 RepID=A0A2S8FRU4_9BACT|nr:MULTISPECIES: hypothetical protein [Pirellulaceae]PQO34896.1 hypothetical protein C5Y83_15510 [Blastopirellula marina]RCS47396.1 hypothetical protein DTL21_15525 [Bremerella cremea]